MNKVGRRIAGNCSALLVGVSFCSAYSGAAHADVIRESQWHLGFLHVPAAMSYSDGSGVTVAVVDTGVDAMHPDLAGAVLPGSDIVGAGDGRADVNGHGTAMAGLIVARGRPNQAGAIGVAPRARVLPVRAGDAGNGLLAESIIWAADHGAGVLCIAIGGAGGQQLEDAVHHAIDADIVVVAAAGNVPSRDVQAPAMYPGVVAAVGVDKSGQHAAISVAGPQAVLAAPAVDIVSTNTGGGYRIGTGTSDATAIIAGVAALVRSKFPQLSAREVIHRMTATAIDKGKPGRDDEYGYGIVNPVGALTADVPPLSESQSSSPAPPSIGAQPKPDNKGSSAALGWLIGAVLLAAAGTGAAIAIRRARR